MSNHENDDHHNEILKEEIIYRKRVNQRKYERLASKSYILKKKQQENNPFHNRKMNRNKPSNLNFIEQDETPLDTNREIELEQNLDDFLDKMQMKTRHKKEVEIAPWFSHTKLGDYIVRNIDLFTTTFVEANALVLTYPAQTLKTRIQSRHSKQDVCHFRKNKVDKARKNYSSNPKHVF